MRNRARWAAAAAAVTVAGPLLAATAAPADAATLPGCPTATGKRVTDTPATYPKTVALTFDDGPNPNWTPQVLAVLAKHRVHATFFVIGKRAAAYPDVLQRIVDAGQVVGNHTWDHPTVGRDMYTLSAAQLVTEFDPTTALIKDATGRPVCFFRAPQGKDNTPMIRKLAKDRGQTVTGYYTASDYLQPGHLDPQWVARIEQRLEGKGNHPVLLMHDGGVFRGNSVQALDAIITWYASRGYVFTDPAGRPFPGDLPAGAKVPATGWAIPPGWTPPGDPLTGARPTDLPSFGGTTTGPSGGGNTGSGNTGPGNTGPGNTGPRDAGPGAPAGSTATTDGTASPSAGADGTLTGQTSTAGSGAPGADSAGPGRANGTSGGQRTSANQRLARLAANSAEDPLAARKLSDALARYLMVFSTPPA
jgi:peptidoglycan/xylan/chitin deacetylase (PgdA/CDA1 family)